MHSNTSIHHQTISSAQKVVKKIADLALAIMTVLVGIENNVIVRPGYFIATTLKPGYVGTTHESTF